MSANRVFADLKPRRDSSASFKALFDTGAAVSLLHPRDRLLLRDRGLPMLRLRHSAKVMNASQQPMNILGAWKCRFYIGDNLLDGVFLECPDVQHSIIGMNIVRSAGLTLDAFSNRVVVANAKERRNATDLKVAAVGTGDLSDAPIGLLKVAEETSISPRLAQRIRVQVTSMQGVPIRQPLEAIADVDLLNIVFRTNENGQFHVYFPNASLEPRLLKRGQTIGQVHAMEDFDVVTTANVSEVAEAQKSARTLRPHSAEEKAKIKDMITTSVNASVPEALRQDYISDLMKLEHFFSSSTMDMGKTDLIQHELEVIDPDSTIYKQQFRLGLDSLQMIKESVLGWMEAGIIQKTASRHNAPVFTVPKKGGHGLRTVLDYRMLNAASQPNYYSIRTIEQCIEEVGRAESKVFSALDLTNGYWQVPLRPSDKPFTAFTIPGVGQFQWCTTPQGLMGAPATFSRLMDKILGDAAHVVTYLDDVLVHSASHGDHRKHLAATIRRLGAANLRLNPKKCVFGAASLEYLGHTLTSSGIKPGSDKVAALKDLAPPSTMKQLRSFLGLTNYFRGFVFHYSRLVQPLQYLTTKAAGWKGGELPPDAAEAYHKVKAAITSRPVMAFPRPQGTFHLYVDAALGDSRHKGGIGAVLFQDQPDGPKKPIAYASRTLTAHEMNYPAFIAEMTAALYGMRQFEHYLKGKKFFLYSDHKPLQHVNKTHSKTLNRLQLLMSEMFPVIKHVSGKDNSVADYLSRYHVEEPTADVKPQVAALWSHRALSLEEIDCSPRRIQMLQAADPLIGPILQSLKPAMANSTVAHPTCVDVKGIPRPVTIVNDILYVKPALRKGFTLDKGFLIVAPQSMIPEIVKESHNSALAGHGGIFKTMEDIRARFWWPSMEHDVAQHLKACDTCLKTTNKGKPKKPPMSPLPLPSKPQERIHIDLSGPHLARTDDGGTTKKFIMVITDAFTKFTRLYVIPNKEAATCASAIFKHICGYGVPRLIITDQGKEWNDLLNNNILNNLNIEHRLTSPYHPQTDGQAEVFNKTMKSYIRKSIEDNNADPLDWEQFIEPLMFSYNTAIHSATKTSPHDALFGYDPRAPKWGAIPDPPDNPDVPLRDAANRRDVVQRVIHHNIQHFSQATKDQYDKSAGPHTSYAPGEFVYFSRLGVQSTNPKFETTWDKGIIVNNIHPDVYYIFKVTPGGRKRYLSRNAQFIKPVPAGTDTSEWDDKAPLVNYGTRPQTALFRQSQLQASQRLTDTMSQPVPPTDIAPPPSPGPASPAMPDSPQEPRRRVPHDISITPPQSPQGEHPADEPLSPVNPPPGSPQATYRPTPHGPSPPPATASPSPGPPPARRRVSYSPSTHPQPTQSSQESFHGFNTPPGTDVRPQAEDDDTLARTIPPSEDSASPPRSPLLRATFHDPSDTPTPVDRTGPPVAGSPYARQHHYFNPQEACHRQQQQHIHQWSDHYVLRPNIQPPQRYLDPDDPRKRPWDPPRGPLEHNPVPPSTLSRNAHFSPTPSKREYAEEIILIKSALFPFGNKHKIASGDVREITRALQAALARGYVVASGPAHGTVRQPPQPLGPPGLPQQLTPAAPQSPRALSSSDEDMPELEPHMGWQAAADSAPAATPSRGNSSSSYSSLEPGAPYDPTPRPQFQKPKRGHNRFGKPRWKFGSGWPDFSSRKNKSPAGGKPKGRQQSADPADRRRK